MFRITWKEIISIYFLLIVGALLFVTIIVGIKGFSSAPYIRAGYVIPLLSLLLLYSVNIKFNYKGFGSAGFSSVIKWLVICSIFWAIIGFGHGIGLYLVTDMLYFLLFLLSYLVVKSSLGTNMPSAGVVVEFLVKAAGVLAISQLLIILTGNTPSGILYLYLFCIFTLIILFGKKEYKSIAVVIGISLLVSIALFNRAFYLQALVVSFVLYITVLQKKNKIKVFLLAVVVIVLLAVLMQGKAGSYFKGTPLERRINETIIIFSDGVSKETSIPMLQRLYEKDTILESFENEPWRYGFGFGFGATINMSSSLDSSLTNSQLMGAGSTHNVHFLHMALLYRYGLAGIILYSLILIMIIKNIYRCGILIRTRGPSDDLFLMLFGNVYPLALIFYSSTASATLFIDPLFGFALAFSDYAKNRISITK